MHASQRAAWSRRGCGRQRAAAHTYTHTARLRGALPRTLPGSPPQSKRTVAAWRSCRLVRRSQGHVSRVGAERASTVRAMVFANRSMATREHLEPEVVGWVERFASGQLPAGNGPGERGSFTQPSAVALQSPAGPGEPETSRGGPPPRGSHALRTWALCVPACRVCCAARRAGAVGGRAARADGRRAGRVRRQGRQAQVRRNDTITLSYRAARAAAAAVNAAARPPSPQPAPGQLSRAASLAADAALSSERACGGSGAVGSRERSCARVPAACCAPRRAGGPWAMSRPATRSRPLRPSRSGLHGAASPPHTHSLVAGASTLP